MCLVLEGGSQIRQCNGVYLLGRLLTDTHGAAAAAAAAEAEAAGGVVPGAKGSSGDLLPLGKNMLSFWPKCPMLDSRNSTHDARNMPNYAWHMLGIFDLSIMPKVMPAFSSWPYRWVRSRRTRSAPCASCSAWSATARCSSAWQGGGLRPSTRTTFNLPLFLLLLLRAGVVFMSVLSEGTR
jgi:hypothetical protein